MASGDGLAIQGGAAAFCGAFTVLAGVNMLHSFTSSYQLYVVLALSCTANLVAYGAYAAYWTFQSPGLLAMWSGLTASGFGLLIAVCCLLLSGWCEDVHYPFRLSYSSTLVPFCKLLAGLVIVAGCCCGIVSAGMLYGSWNVRLQKVAVSIRSASAWGLWCTVALLLLVLMCISAPVSWPNGSNWREPIRSWRRGGVLILWPVIWLLLFSATFSVVTTFHTNFSMDPALFYPLIAAPGCLATLVLSWPFVLGQIGVAGQFETYMRVKDRGYSWAAAKAFARKQRLRHVRQPAVVQGDVGAYPSDQSVYSYSVESSN